MLLVSYSVNIAKTHVKKLFSCFYPPPHLPTSGVLCFSVQQTFIKHSPVLGTSLRQVPWVNQRLSLPRENSAWSWRPVESSWFVLHHAGHSLPWFQFGRSRRACPWRTGPLLAASMSPSVLPLRTLHACGSTYIRVHMCSVYCFIWFDFFFFDWNDTLFRIALLYFLHIISAHSAFSPSFGGTIIS